MKTGTSAGSYSAKRGNPMSIRMDCRSVWRSRCVLLIVVLFLAGAGRANAQASCIGVSNDTQGAVTWVPQWCQEFNATTAGPPDTTVWSFDLGNSGFGNNELETYCGPPGYSGNRVLVPLLSRRQLRTPTLTAGGRIGTSSFGPSTLADPVFRLRRRTPTTRQPTFKNFYTAR